MFTIFAQLYIKDIHRKGEYTHCRNDVSNLAIARACKNSSIQRFMTSLTEAANFLEASPKRRQYFETLIEFL